jgi:prepilin-type N-terminal cleavage/methylation domain-containing protein
MKVFCPKLKTDSRTAQSVQPTALDLRLAFTLIEIMVAIGIVAIILAIGIPSVYQQMHRDSMRQAIADVSELCRDARNEAVLRGVTVELRISPMNRTMSVNLGTAQAETGTSAVNTEQARETFSAGGAASSSKKISDHIQFRALEVNLVPNPELADRSCLFYKNGTSDELQMVILSDRGEVRKITTDPVIGIADVEIER